MVGWRVKGGKNRIAKAGRSGFCRLQSYCDALVNEVWMVKEFGVIGFFAPGEDGNMDFCARLPWCHLMHFNNSG